MENGRMSSSSVSASDVFDPAVYSNGEIEAKKQLVVEWLNSVLPNLRLPTNASEEEFRACLLDGTVLCQLLNKLRPGSVPEYVGYDRSLELRSENVKKFLAAMDRMRLPRFKASDIEKGPIKNVLECLLTLRAHHTPNKGKNNLPTTGAANKTGGTYGSPKGVSDSKFQSPIMAETSAALIHHVGHKFHEVFQLKQGSYADLPAAKISEMMKSNSLDTAPTQSLLSVVNGILDESIERKNGEIPYRVACLLRTVVQEIERRISTQAEHLRTQSNLFKTREEKYQSRIRVLEALASGTTDETQFVADQLQQIKTEKTKMEERKKLEDQDVARLIEENDNSSHEISALKEELEIARKAYEQRFSQVETEAKGAHEELEERLKEAGYHLSESRNRIKELEAYSESKCQQWNKKENIYQIFTEFQLGALRELKFASQSIKQEVLKTQRSYTEEFHHLGTSVKTLAHESENYHAVLAENRKMYNELQDLKGNIRVYCRIRPFLPGQTEKQSSIQYIGENGELVVANPSTGKDGHRSFKFNKVYGQAATQVSVFSDTQPLIRSVLDGYNVCIFAYGQTGSGKTYTMTGPEGASEEEWGVNYRALNDLFHISENRRNIYTFDIGVQMIEIYNEQVRDLLSSDTSQKRLGILSTSQPHGLAVPDASMHSVKSTADVLELIDIGQKNRAKGATALNERSSRSHSVVTVHVRGTDLKSGASLRGSLHLVDLAGSERVERSEVTGDRLKEAQHINKSLSALGDVIFALAQKSSHVPYRNSKLTQVLQSSLGGQAKTLMFVQLNPEVSSFSETVSTLKFAERVSGVELGAARSSKEGKDVRDLMEQVTSLKDAIAKRDEEIERLQLLKDPKNANASEKRVRSSLRYNSSSPNKSSPGRTPQQNLKLSKGKSSEKPASDHESSENSDKHSEATSQQTMDDLQESHQQSQPSGSDIGQIFSADAEIIGYSDAEIERISDVSDERLSMGTETDGSAESNPLPEGTKTSESLDKSKSASRIQRPPRKSPMDPSKESGLRKSSSGSNLAAKPPPKRWL